MLFMDSIMEVNGIVNSFVWGPPMLFLLLGTGLYLSFRTNFFSVLKFGFVMKNTAYKENVADALDMAVPPGSVPNLLKDINRIAKKYNTISPAVGHIADGNVHNFLMLDNGKLPVYLEDMRNEMYEAALSYGGTITAEHGTGKTRKKHMTQQYTAREIEIMKNIKKSFDPNGILSPGTILD